MEQNFKTLFYMFYIKIMYYEKNTIALIRHIRLLFRARTTISRYNGDAAVATNLYVPE